MQKNIILKILVLFLLLSQFVTMAHAFEHETAHEESEQCFVCLHKTELDNILVEAASFTPVIHYYTEKVLHQNQTAYLHHYSLPNNRSPPVIL